MKKLKIAFVNFWVGFDDKNNFIVEAIRKFCPDIEVTVPSDDVDVLFYSCFGAMKHYAFRHPIRIYFTGENDVPNFNECDYALSFHDIDFDNRHLRFPLYATYTEEYDVLRSRRFDTLGEELFDRPFCSAVISNSGFDCDGFRAEFFEKLNAYKSIASGGRYANNVGGPVKDKIEFISGYKFNLAFENCRINGYVTEKLQEALSAATLPIYYGAPNVARDFNPKSYIDVSKFPAAGDAIEYIAKVDADRSLYLDYLRTSPLTDVTRGDWDGLLSAFLKRAVACGKQCVPYGRMHRMTNRAALGAKFIDNRLVCALHHRLNPKSEIKI